MSRQGLPHHNTPSPGESPAAMNGGVHRRYRTLSKLRGIGRKYQDFREPSDVACEKCGLTGEHECLRSIYHAAASRPGDQG